MWVAIWLILTLFILGFVGWSMKILFQQKQAWRSFAKKHKLTYDPVSIMSSPVVKGKINGFRVTLYSDARQTNDVRGQRFVTIIDIEMGEGFPTGAAIATKELRPFIDQLVFEDSFVPEGEWDETYIVRTRDDTLLQVYLTPERVKLINSLFKLKNASVLLFFDEQESVLHIETSDPLKSAEHLEKVIMKMLKGVEKLAPSEEEKRTSKRKAAELLKAQAEKALAETGDKQDAEPAEKKSETQESDAADRTEPEPTTKEDKAAAEKTKDQASSKSKKKPKGDK